MRVDTVEAKVALATHDRGSRRHKTAVRTNRQNLGGDYDDDDDDDDGDDDG